jgi:hypothetical protein
VFDVFGGVVYLEANRPEVLHAHGLTGLDPQALLKDMQAVTGGRTYKGYEAYRVLFFRLPLLWPFIPLIFLGSLFGIGNRIYRHVADSRRCSVPAVGSASLQDVPNVSRPHASNKRQEAFLIGIGLLLIIGNFILGAMGKTQAWPFSCYPKFDYILKGKAKSIIMMVETSEGYSTIIDLYSLRGHFHSSRWRGILMNILYQKDWFSQKKMIEDLWSQLRTYDQSLSHIHKVRFYKVEISTVPEERSRNPLDLELLHEIKE